MKKSILSIVAMAAVLIMSGSANAQSANGLQNSAADQATILASFCQRQPTHKKCVSTPPIREVPEIDASSGTQALALVLGLGLLSAEGLRRRRRAIRTR
mgnify:FL=1